MSAQPSTTEKVVLLLSLVPYLLEHGPTPVSEIAAQFDIREHEVRRLARFLGTAGVPGETRTYQHEDLFDIDWQALEEHDILSLISAVAVDDTPRFSSTESAALQAGLHMLRSVLPDEWEPIARSTAAKLATSVPKEATSEHVTISAEPTGETIRALTQAIRDHVRITFTYRSRPGTVTTREVDPHYLTQERGTWYLQGYCWTRADTRNFRVDTINDLTLTSDAIVHEAAAKLPVNDASDSRWFDIEGTFRIRSEFLYLVHAWHPRTTEPDVDGWTTVTIPLLAARSAIEFITMAPGSIVAVGPEAVRDAVAHWARQVLEASVS